MGVMMGMVQAWKPYRVDTEPAPPTSAQLLGRVGPSTLRDNTRMLVIGHHPHTSIAVSVSGH